MDTICITTLAFIDGLGAPEMVLIFVVVLVLFGGQKLPEFARGLGKSIREFKKAAAGVEEEFKRALDEDERKNNTPKLTAPPSTPSTTDTYSDHAGPGYDEYAPSSEETSTPAEPETESDSNSETKPQAASGSQGTAPITPTPATPSPASAAPAASAATPTPGATTPASASPASVPTSSPASSAGHPENP
jgi:TatA/E family protein of Tat protein translocase